MNCRALYLKLIRFSWEISSNLLAERYRPSFQCSQHHWKQSEYEPSCFPYIIHALECLVSLSPENLCFILSREWISSLVLGSRGHSLDDPESGQWSRYHFISFKSSKSLLVLRSLSINNICIVWFWMLSKFT